jgi:hypothetical protein
MVILSATAIVIVSLLFGSARGIIWEVWRNRRRGRELMPPEAARTIMPQHGGQR